MCQSTRAFREKRDLARAQAHVVAQDEERVRAQARARMATKADRLRRLKITETQQRNRKQKLLNRKQKLFRIDRANVIKQVSSVGRSRLRHVWPQWLCDTISREVLTPAQYKTNERRIACCTPTQPPRRKRPKRRSTSTPPCRGSTPHRSKHRQSRRLFCRTNVIFLLFLVTLTLIPRCYAAPPPSPAAAANAAGGSFSIPAATPGSSNTNTRPEERTPRDVTYVPYNSDGGDVDLITTGAKTGSETGSYKYNKCMDPYIYKLYDALGDERGKMKEWMKEYLDNHGWIIRRECAKDMCKQLKIGFGEPAYYMDVDVWMPDKQFGKQPHCPTCRSNESVKRDGKDMLTPARRATNWTRDYYVIGFRYECTACEKEHRKKSMKQVKGQTTLLAALPNQEEIKSSDTYFNKCAVDSDDDDANSNSGGASGGASGGVNGGVSGRASGGAGREKTKPKKKPSEKHSFKAWDRVSLQLSPFRTHFKTVFTKKGGVHEDIVSMLEADLTTGMRGEQFANKIMELQTKEYHRQYIQREREFLRSREVGSGVDKGPRVAQLKEFFSDFDDPDGYDGRLRCAKFYKELFMDYSEACGEHCDKEVKKRGAERLHFDASYKVSKLLCRVFGLAGYKCLQTGLNEFGEIVVQVFTYSDAYDQMITPLHAMNETAKQYGQPGVQLFTSDKPRCDRNMSHAAFPGVKALQRVYDKGG